MFFEDLLDANFLIIIPILYFLGKYFKSRPDIKDANIPLFVVGVGALIGLIKAIVLSGIAAKAIEHGVEQGILCGIITVYGHVVYKQKMSDGSDRTVTDDEK